MKMVDLLNRIIEYSPHILIGIFIFFISWVLSGIVGRILEKTGNKLTNSKGNVIRLGATICRIGIIIIGLVTGLGTMGVNVSALVAGLGLTGFALGFAVKDMLSNLLAGVLLLIYEPFKIGDWISTSECEGKIKDINLRYTVLEKNKDSFYIPNSILFTNTIRVSSVEL